MSFLDNYEGVADRIKRFWATYPTGKIHTSIMDVDIKQGYILIECRIYKNYEDEQPAGIDYAFGNVATYNVNMKKWFVEDTVTSAIGRCAGLVLGTDTRPTQENMRQVESVPVAYVNEPVEDLWAQPFGEVTVTATREAGFTTAGDAIAEIKSQLGGVQVAAAPICAHGHMVWRSGDKGGKAWGGYMCVEKNKAKQCSPRWFVLASDGQWKPQV
jgi:hypothetical protein